MRTHRSWFLSGLATVLAVAVGSVTLGQGYPYPAPQGLAPAGYPLPPGMGAGQVGPPPMGAYAPGMVPSIMPAGYGVPLPSAGPMAAGVYGPGGGYPAGPMVGPGVCSECGGAGCPSCLGDPAAHDFDIRILRWLLPYGAGGIAEPRWYDVYADAMYMKRDTVSRRVDFMSNGAGGPIVLSSDSLTFNEEIGFRVGGQIQIGNGNVLEAHYMGTFNWDSRAQVADAGGNLYSTFSDFGLSPIGGFQDTDQASFASIDYSTNFHSVEMNYRQRWMAPNPRLQGSWLLGVRFFELSETFRHQITAAAGWTDYNVSTYNAMTGFQVGGDLWLTIMPGLRVGAEVKGGLFGNRAKQGTVLRAASIANPVVETAKSRGVAFLGEAQVEAIWRISHRWTFRAGYEFLYVDSVALAIENFNDGPPFVLGQRTVMINDGGDAFYHGGFAGFEWMW